MRKRIKGVILGVGVLILGCGLSWHSTFAQGESRRSDFPRACYFFAPEKRAANELPDELAYGISVDEVWRLWCTAAGSSEDQRTAAVDEMVKRWKAVWERERPFNAEFHETSAFDLLKLMGLTHQLPAEMVSNPKFKQEWIQACKENCFTIWSVPTTSAQEHWLAMELWLRNDLLDNFMQEPASEPVINMLREAQYRLVD